MKCHSINFLKCVSKIRTTPCYAFTHKTFQESFAAFYLEREMIACDEPRRDALRLVFTSDGVVVGVVIRRAERYDLVKIKPTMILLMSPLLTIK